VPLTLVSVLTAILRIHGGIYEREVRWSLAKWQQGLSNEQLAQVFRLAGDDPRSWAWLPKAAQIRGRFRYSIRQPDGTWTEKVT